MALNIQTIENQSMKYLLTLLTLLITSASLVAQGISVVAEDGSSSPGANEFPLNGSVLSIDSDRYMIGDEVIMNPLAWSLSKEGNRIAFLRNRGGVEITTLSSEGEVIHNQILDFFDPADETLSVYQFGDGKTVLRDNVANFTFLNSKGEISYSVSNSSGSPEGERESRLASDDFGATVVLYNPVIARENGTASRAQIVFGDRDLLPFFNSNNEEIRHVETHLNGRFISIITTDGNESGVYLYDRLGNELYESGLEEAIIGVSLSADARYLTAYSSSRMLVFDMITGERSGSASSRTSILFANYDPASQTILALGGVQSGMNIQSPEITAVSLSQRKIERVPVPFSLSLLDSGRLDLERTGSNRYRLSGLNKTLLLDVTF